MSFRENYGNIYQQAKGSQLPPVSTARDYGLDVSPYLPQIVGSRAQKDILFKKAWAAEQPFIEWRENQKYPDRLYYKAHWEDLDGDGIEDFAIRNKYNKLVGVNGYTTRKGHFPYKQWYLDEHPDKESQQNDPYTDWMRTKFQPTTEPNSLRIKYEHVNEPELKSHYIKRKLGNKISPYLHFVKVFGKEAFNKARDNFAELEFPENVENYEAKRNHLAVPNQLFITLISNFWDVNIIQPIIEQIGVERVKSWLSQKARTIKDKAANDGFNLEDGQCRDKAYSALKSTKEFKQAIEKVYLSLINDKQFISHLETFMNRHFGPAYKNLSDGKILFKKKPSQYSNKTGEEGVFMDVEGTELSPRYNYSGLPLFPGGKTFSRQYKEVPQGKRSKIGKEKYSELGPAPKLFTQNQQNINSHGFTDEDITGPNMEEKISENQGKK